MERGRSYPDKVTVGLYAVMDVASSMLLFGIGGATGVKDVRKQW